MPIAMIIALGLFFGITAANATLPATDSPFPPIHHACEDSGFPCQVKAQ